jgi:hypothetical protein
VLVERNVESIAAGIDKALNRGWDPDAVRARVESRTWRAVGREVAEELRAAVEGEPRPYVPKAHAGISEEAAR